MFKKTRCKSLLVIVLLIALAMTLVGFIPQNEEEVEVPIESQYRLFDKILRYNKNIQADSEDGFVIAVGYQSRVFRSISMRDTLIRLGQTNPIFVHGGQATFITVDLSNLSNLSDFLRDNSVDVLIVPPIRILNVSDIAQITRQNNVLSFTVVPDYCEQGITLGIGLRANRPEIIINLDASRLEGVDFSSKLLRFGKIVTSDL